MWRLYQEIQSLYTVEVSYSKVLAAWEFTYAIQGHVPAPSRIALWYKRVLLKFHCVLSHSWSLLRHDKKKRHRSGSKSETLTGYCLSTSRNESKSRVANFFICAFYFMFAILFILSHFFNTPKKTSIPVISYNIGTRKIYWSWFMKWSGDKFIFTSTCIAVQTILFTTNDIC